MEFEGYLQFLTKLGTQFDQLTAIEQEKIQAVKDGNLAWLNDCIRKEQANSLAMRGMEQQRTEWLKGLGLKDGALRNLPQQCPAQYRQQANQVVQDVLRQYQVLESAREASRTLLECQLHRIEGEMSDRGMGPEADQAGQNQPPRRTWTDFRA